MNQLGGVSRPLQEETVPIDNVVVGIVNRLTADGTSLDAQLETNNPGANAACVEKVDGSEDESDMEDCSD